MKCYQVRSGETIIAEFDTQEEANNFINSNTINGNMYDTFTETGERITPPRVPQYFIGTGETLNISRLEEFFKYDNMYSIAMNNMLYGSAMIGHKDFVDVVKRNGLLLSDGPSLGHNSVDRVGVIKSTVIDGVDTQDAQTYANPSWYVNTYLTALGKANKEVKRIYREKVIPGFELTPEELKVLNKYNAKITSRKLVFRNHVVVIKTSFNTLDRQAYSRLIRDTPEIRQTILDLWDGSTNTALTKSEYQQIINEIHSYYEPILGKEYHHNMLNDMELKKTDYIVVDSAAKLLKPNTGQYKDGVFQYQQVELSSAFLREQVPTDAKRKDVVDASQKQGLAFVEQNLDGELATNIATKKSTVKIKSLVDKQFDLKSKRQEFSANELANRLIDSNGNINKKEIVRLLESKSFKVKSESVVKQLLSDESISLSNNFVSKDTMNAIMSELSKTLQQRVAGTSYTLASSHGFNVIVDNNNNVVPQNKYYSNRARYSNVSTRRLEFGKLDKNKNVYYAEVVVSQDILDKFGGNLDNINSEMLLGLGVRIPTEGKNSMVVIKIVDVLPKHITGIIYAPNELIKYSGADFDIDKLFVRHYDVYTKESAKIKYGNYLNRNTQEARLEEALEEYNAENEDNPISIEEFNNRFGKTVESNYNAKSFLDIEPITKAELNNLLLDIEMLLAYNEYNKEQAEYPNSLDVWKEIILPYLEENNLDDDSSKLLTGISSAIDKLIAKESIDVGGDNIGVAATFNIMYSLLNFYNIKLEGKLIEKNLSFSENTTIDLGTTELDSKGLTKNGEIRKTALIATLINMMTDNAKEQLAKYLNLDKNNLSGFLIGIGTGLDIKALTLIYNLKVNDQIQGYELPNGIDKLVAHAIKTGDYRLENLNEVNEEIYKKIKLDDSSLDRLVKILQTASVYTSKDMGKELPRFLGDSSFTKYNDISSGDFLALNKLLIDSYKQTASSLSTELIRLNTIRSLVKGIDSEFIAFDNLYKAMYELSIQYESKESVLNTDLDKHVIIKDNNVYYRTQLGNNSVIKYTFEANSQIGNIAIINKEIFALMANAVLFDNHIAKYAHLKRSTILRHFFRPNSLVRYKDKRSIITPLYEQLSDAFISNLNTKIFANKMSKYYTANPSISYIHKLFKPNYFYVNKEEIQDNGNIIAPRHTGDLLVSKLLQSPKYADNLFLNQLAVRYRPSELKTGANVDKLLVSFEINTVSNETSERFRDNIANDFSLLNVPLNHIQVLDKIASQGVDSLTDDEAAGMLYVILEAYSFVVNAHSFKPNGVSMFLSAPLLKSLYNKLTDVERLFNQYNDLPMTRKNSKSFNIKFKELTGKYFERFLLEFLHFESANNGFATLLDDQRYKKYSVTALKKKYGEKSTYGYSRKNYSMTITHNGKPYTFEYMSKIDFINAINETNEDILTALQSDMRIYNNTRFLLYTTANNIKPAVFPPSIMEDGTTQLLTNVLTAEGKKGNIRYYQYFYDYKTTGKVFRREIGKDGNPISDVEESLFMPITGYLARYSRVSKYVDSQFSNVLPFSMYTQDIDMQQGAFDGKEVIDGAKSALEQEDNTDNQVDNELEEDKDSEVLDDLYKLDQELELLELELDRYRNTAYGEIVDSIKSNKYTPQSAKAEAGVKVGIKKDIPIHLISSKGNTVAKVAENIADRENIEREGYTYEDIRDMIIDYLQGNIKLRNEKEILKEIKIVKDLIKQIQQGLDVQIDFSKQEEVEPTDVINNFEAKYASSGAKKVGYDKKDVAKFNNKITKLISRGSELSSSQGYAKEFKEKGLPVNVQDYSSNDVVGISAEGQRANRVKPDLQLITKAANVGVIFITDAVPTDYNIGEKEVHEHLTSLGYTNNNGVWTKEGSTTEVEPTESTPTNATQIYSQLTETPNVEIDTVAGRKASTSRGIVAYRTRGNNFLEAFEKDRTIGNPWNSRGYALYKTNTVKESVIEFTKWLIGEAHTDKLQDYRQAIIDNLDNLRGRKIIYYEELNEPSHATALDYLINKYDWSNQPTTESVERYINPINIKADKLNPNSLGNRLTNPNWYSKGLMDVETPYKANASKIKAPQLNPQEALKYDMNLMYKLQVEKFRKNPELIDEINQAGGLEFIKQSSHIVGVKNSRWEGKGMESNFIKVLARSYETVAKELNKFQPTPEVEPIQEETKDVIKPSTQALGGIKGIKFFEQEEDLGSEGYSLLQPIEFINAILNKYQVNGRIPKSKELDVFNEVERYNKGLGYEAVTINEVSDTIKLTTNIEAQSRSKSSKETVINILNKLSNKFNIPYELDYNLPHKGMFVKGKVIVNPNLLTDDTPFHEFAHPFIAAIKRMNRPLYNQLITQIKQEKTILDRTDKLYRQLYVNKGLVGAQLENAIIEEAIVTAIGEYAADYNKLYNKSQGLLEAIKEFLSYIKQTIMDMFDKGSINIENIPNDVTLKELAVILASDIKVTNNTKINKEVLNILNQIDIC